jgi:hypothetical protein
LDRIDEAAHAATEIGAADEVGMFGGHTLEAPPPALLQSGPDHIEHVVDDADLTLAAAEQWLQSGPASQWRLANVRKIHSPIVLCRASRRRFIDESVGRKR